MPVIEGRTASFKCAVHYLNISLHLILALTRSVMLVLMLVRAVPPLAGCRALLLLGIVERQRMRDRGGLYVLASQFINRGSKVYH